VKQGGDRASREGTAVASNREGNNLNGFRGFRTENGSSQGRNLALAGLFVPNSLLSIFSCSPQKPFKNAWTEEQVVSRFDGVNFMIFDDPKKTISIKGDNRCVISDSRL